MTVYHIATESTSKGSRILYQESLYKKSKTIPVNFLSIFDKEFLASLKDANSTVIIHQQILLPHLVIALFLRFFGWSKAKIIYDIHDIAETSTNMSPFRRLKKLLSIWLEGFVVRHVDSMTVSMGLARALAKRHGRKFQIVYNMTSKSAPIHVGKEAKLERQKCCYFGVIAPQRISIHEIVALGERGIPVDIFGRYSVVTPSAWRRELEAALAKYGGKYMNEYHPGDLSFLEAYKYSYMAFPSDSFNIKYSMPNKLFQSLENGLICLVFKHQYEAIRCFSQTGYVQLITNFDNSSEESKDKFLLQEKLKGLSGLSFKNFKRLVTH